MARYKTLLFDADNTLFDFHACEREALRLTFEKYKINLTEEIADIYQRINVGLWKQYEQGLKSREEVIYSRFGHLFEEIGIEADGVAFEDDYQALLGMQHVMIDGAEEVIKALYQEYDLYIVTNGVTATQYRRLKDSGLDRYMKKIFVSEETGYQKPMIEYFNYCFERIEGFEKDKAIIIGDSLSSDMKGGNNAGIATCWYNPDRVENHTDIRIDYEIRELTELYQVLN